MIRISERNRLSGVAGETNEIMLMGEQRVGTLRDDISIKFDYGINEDFDVKKEVTGTGSTSVTGSVAKISSGSSGTASLQSKANSVYVNGHTAQFGFTAATSHQPQSIKIYLRRSGTDELIRTIEGDELNFRNVDWTKLNIFEVNYAYYGVAPIIVKIFEPEKPKKELFSLYAKHGTTITTHVGSPRLPVRMSTTSDGITRIGPHDTDDGFFIEFDSGVTGEDNYVLTASWEGGNYAQDSFVSRRSFHYDIDKTTVGTGLQNIVTFRSKSTYAGRANKIRALLQSIDWIAYGANGLTKLYLIKNATPSIAFSFTDYNTANSVMEIDNRDFTLSGGLKGLSLRQYPQVGQGSNSDSFSSSIINAIQNGLFLDPAEGTYSIVVDSADANMNISLGVSWQENF